MTLLEAARAAAARDWRVLLVHALVDGRCTCGSDCGRNAGKHPRLIAWQRLATTDVTTITAWCRQWPTSNLGLATGAGSNLIALDQDGDAGAENLQALEREHGALPETVVNLTGGGGRHYLFEHPGSSIPNAVRLWPGLDVRGDGGQILIAPSRTVGPYAWEIGHEPGTMPLAPVPRWLLERLREGRPTGLSRPPDEWATLVRGPIAEGARNDSLARLAGYLLRCRPAPRVVLELVRAVNQARCQPPLPDHEIERTVDSIARREVERARHVDVEH
jgi:hypothetical protein